MQLSVNVPHISQPKTLADRTEVAMKLRIQRDERGASLVLAIVFMVVVGAIGGGVLASLTSGQNNGTHLVSRSQPRVRGRRRGRVVHCANARGAFSATRRSVCNRLPVHRSRIPVVTIHVDCFNSPVLIAGPGGTILAQNNVTFNACLFTGSGNGDACTASSTIISASVNFQKIGAASDASQHIRAVMECERMNLRSRWSNEPPSSR